MTLKFKAIACLLFLAALVISACASPGQKNTKMTSTENDDRERLTLTAKNRTATQPLPSDLRSPENYKFVEVVVTEVVNPKKYAISFEVNYRPPNGEKIFLGTFSLFPADNPGTFIVPTQGKLKSGGELILSLTLPDDVRDAEPVTITAKKMRLREE